LWWFIKCRFNKQTHWGWKLDDKMTICDGWKLPSFGLKPNSNSNVENLSKWWLFSNSWKMIGDSDFSKSLIDHNVLELKGDSIVLNLVGNFGVP
jgi:hypothetical protein